MNLQQLQYIVAANKTRHFVKAAQACGVSQPTLSAMIQKLEAELDVKIFNRDKTPIEPTEIGAKIIMQAETCLNDVKRIEEVILSEMQVLEGRLVLGILPSIAPYVVPDFIPKFQEQNKEVDLTISEMTSQNLVQHLLKADLDMAIMNTPLNQPDLLEIPLYKERFLAYFGASCDCKDKMDSVSPEQMPEAKLWVLLEGNCPRSDVFNFCHLRSLGETTYQAGSTETLIHIVDNNGGFTVIPQLHTQYLSEEKMKQVRPFDAPDAQREISLVIRKDYLKENMLNAVVDVIKEIIPEDLLEKKIKDYRVRL